ncbi:MAG: hypothetical protein H7332_10165 [Bdellovibrionales bacterium]|nr:hypothetical protein [Ramlibacter sp.]
MSEDLPAQLTPLQRLARSREAIARELGGDVSDYASRDDLGPEWGQASSDSPERKMKAKGKARGGWWPVLTSMADAWWRRHPLNAVTHMARPVLESFARQEPVKLLGIAVLVGVVVVVFRPWRLLTTGALVAVLRPSEITGFAMSMMSSLNETLQKDKEQRDAPGSMRR